MLALQNLDLGNRAGMTIRSDHEGNAESSAFVSLGGGAAAVREQAERLKTAPAIPIQIKWRWRAPRTFQLASGESQEDGVRSQPAESGTGLMKKMPHRGRDGVLPWAGTAWLSQDLELSDFVASQLS